MGAFDFVTKPLSVVANIVESVCDAVLPKELEFVGDAMVRDDLAITKAFDGDLRHLDASTSGG